MFEYVLMVGYCMIKAFFLGMPPNNYIRLLSFNNRLVYLAKTELMILSSFLFLLL